MTTLGTEPMTFQLVAQCCNQWCHHVPPGTYENLKFYTTYTLIIFRFITIKSLSHPVNFPEPEKLTEKKFSPLKYGLKKYLAINLK
jgi:hypothetical protein